VALESDFLLNDKLKRCLVNDADHIGLLTLPVADRSGSHVVLIQKALNAFAKRMGFGLIRETGVYDQITADLVTTFKKLHKPPILNFKNQIDATVGKKTVDALDKELPPLRGGSTDTKQKVDVIVKFQGTLGVARRLLPDEIYPNILLTKYSEKKDRTLVRIGQNTNTIKADSAALIANHVAQILSLKEGFKDNGEGKVFIYGSSSGGRNAIDLAAALTKANILITFLATLDAAWFPEDAINSPDNVIGEPTVTPRFNPPGLILADQKKDFFQKFGNHTEIAFRQGKTLFTSKMDGKEIHGNVVFFSPQDFTSQVKAANPISDNDAHIKLTRVATPFVHRQIQLILDSL